MSSNYVTKKNCRILVTYGHQEAQDALRASAQMLDDVFELKGDTATIGVVTVHMEMNDDDTFMCQVVIEEPA